MNIKSFCRRFQVLQPHPILPTIFRALTETQHSYQLSITPQYSMRKYRFDCGNIEKLLQVCQWRLNAVPEVVHCHFVKLLLPKQQLKSTQCQVFIQHIDVTLANMSRLIIQECFYLIISSIRGYQQLFSKFIKISVNQHTIGLNARGQCIVWINRSLHSLTPENSSLSQETQIIVNIIKVVKKKSEPICQGLLSRILKDVQSKRLKFSNILSYLNSIMTNMKIKLPKNLKYLVNQNKILKDIQNLRIKTEYLQSHRKNASPQMTTQRHMISQRYQPIKTEPKSNVFAVYDKKYIQRQTRLSQDNIQKFGGSFDKKIMTEKAINFKKQSYISTNMSSVVAKSDKKVQFRNNSSDRNQFNFRIFSRSRQRGAISKCKSYEGENSNIFIINAAKPLQKIQFSSKSKQKNQKQTPSMFYSKANNINSQRSNSYRPQVHKNQHTKIYKSFIVDFPKRVDINNKSIGQQCQQKESSPKKDRVDNSDQDNVISSHQQDQGDKEGISRIQECLKANQWIKILDSHQLWVESKLNTSITVGPERNTYLEDVKLERLELLSRRMAASRIPADFHSLIANSMIQ